MMKCPRRPDVLVTQPIQLRFNGPVAMGAFLAGRGIHYRYHRRRRTVFPKALRSLKTFSLDMNVLMTAAVIGSRMIDAQLHGLASATDQRSDEGRFDEPISSLGEGGL